MRPALLASQPRHLLQHGWQLCSAPPGRFADPAALNAWAEADWLAVPELGTVAAVLRAAGRWSLDGPARRFDEQDWWYRLRFDAPGPVDRTWTLGLDGLATLVEVWLNGERLLQSSNMFQAHELSLGERLQAHGNELVLRFAALDAELAKRRPRPRWRAPMVEHQQLRAVRTTLLGRTPGWSPPAAAVGPWKDVWLAQRRSVTLTALRLNPVLQGDTGWLHCSVQLQAMAAGAAITQVQLWAEREGEGPQQHLQTLAQAHPPAEATQATTYQAELPVPQVQRWWPHTHGRPALYRCGLVVHLAGQAEPIEVDLGAVGFRSLHLDTAGGHFKLQVNGEPVFCRGACWTPLDVVSLRHSPEAVQQAVAQVRAAGMNMLRVAGPMVYEDSAFRAACDAHGVLVWQDFMFANMDYPAADPAFLASTLAEADQQLAAWQGHACLAVLCGNSEVEQQAAMWSAARELWRSPLFDTHLPERCQHWRPDVPYWPSSAHGGAFPHQVNQGSTSYYGVGAYLRPLEDARRSELRFATECLALAQIPEPGTIARMPGGHALKVHHPGWKARTPRDLNAGWDFEDVRDHYLAALFDVDPTRLRSTDPAHYLALSRLVPGELIRAAYAEWRRPGSGCGGALLWWLRDLWAGAGWGLLDDQGLPKAGYWAAKRALQPVTVFTTDEGCNGLVAHLINETASPVAAKLHLATYAEDGTALTQAHRAVTLPPRSAQSLPLAELLEGFADLSYAFRFGPVAHALVVTRLEGAQGLIAQDLRCPAGLPAQRQHALGLGAQWQRGPGSSTELVLSTRALALGVHFVGANFVAEDAYFHLPPHSRHVVRVSVADETSMDGTCPAPQGWVTAVNWHGQAPITATAPPSCPP